MRRLKTLLILAVLATTAAVPAAAQARTNVRVGIADQQIGMFDAPGYKSLKLKLTRYFIRWDARKDPASLAATDAYVRKARTPPPRGPLPPAGRAPATSRCSCTSRRTPSSRRRPTCLR